MTKLKSKEMTKSTFAVIIMAVVMVAMLAFGGTYAYFTATAAAVSKEATTGTVKLGANSAATLVTTKVVSGQELIAEDSSVQVTSESNVATWVFVTFTVELTTLDEDATVNDVSATKTLTKDGDYYLDYAVDGWELVTGKTNIYAKSVAADTTDPITVCDSIKFFGWSESTATAAGSLMGATVKVTIESSAIQATAEDGTPFDKDTAYAALVAGNSVVE